MIGGSKLLTPRREAGGRRQEAGGRRQEAPASLLARSLYLVVVLLVEMFAYGWEEQAAGY